MVETNDRRFMSIGDAYQFKTSIWSSDKALSNRQRGYCIEFNAAIFVGFNAYANLTENRLFDPTQRPLRNTAIFVRPAVELTIRWLHSRILLEKGSIISGWFFSIALVLIEQIALNIAASLAFKWRSWYSTLYECPKPVESCRGNSPYAVTTWNINKLPPRTIAREPIYNTMCLERWKSGVYWVIYLSKVKCRYNAGTRQERVNLAILPAEMVQNGARPNAKVITSAEIANLNNDGVADTWLPYSKIILPPLTKFKTTSSLSADTKRSGGR